jgi:RNA polymerase sigma-70 factor (ECF subfamily)
MTTQTPEDDKRLMELIVQQDLDALGTLYNRYSNGVYALAMQMLKDSGAAEEVVQDAFHNVWRRAASYHPDRGKVTSWLFSIAHHRAIDEIRRRRRDREHVQHGVDIANRPSEGRGDPVEYTALSLEGRRIKEALNVLRKEQREIVMLAYYGGFTHSEIAAKLDQPLGTVKTRMRLALKKLREVLGPQPQEGVKHGM